MTIIDRYAGTTFLGSYLILLLVGVGLYIFSDMLVNLDEFTENRTLSAGQVLLNMTDYYGYNLPLYYQQLGGALMTIAAAFTFAMMLKNNELTPLVAAGVPLQRLAVPVLACSVLLVGLWMANSELVVPGFADKIARHHDDLGDTRQVEVQCVRDDNNAILIAQELHAQQGWLKGVYIIEPDETGAPQQLIQADAAFYDPQRRTWRLDRGARQQMGVAFGTQDLGHAIQRVQLDEYAFTLSPEQILLRQSSQWADLMSLGQMNTLLRSRNLPNLPAVAKSRDIRFTQPLLTWIMMLLAMPFFLTREPGNVLVAGGKALLLTGLCFSFVFMAQGVSTDPYTTRLATALPVLVFGPVAVLHFANVKT
jgi:lipopolysaccharide export LptBFGC system permease protein LptF